MYCIPPLSRPSHAMHVLLFSVGSLTPSLIYISALDLSSPGPPFASAGVDFSPPSTLSGSLVEPSTPHICTLISFILLPFPLCRMIHSPPNPTLCTLLFLRLLFPLNGPSAPVKPPTPLLSSLPPYPIGAHFLVSFVAPAIIPFNIGSSSVLFWHLLVASFSNNHGKPGSGFSLRMLHSSVVLLLVDYGSPLGNSFTRDLAFPPPHWPLPLLLLPHSLNFPTCSL